MILDVSHKTEYHFSEAPLYGLQQVRLTPQSYAGQRVLSWELTFKGGNVESTFSDQYENIVHLVRMDEGATQLTLASEGRVEMADMKGVIGPHEGFAPLWLFKRDTPLTTPGKGIGKLIKAIRKSPAQDIEKLHALSQNIGSHVRYELGTTDTMTTAEEAIKAKSGVCQDHSHIFIAAARKLGFPARYVSGYLMMTDRIAQDATHAWAEAHIPDLGWVGFDVSNQISPDARYVRVATGLDYSDSAPISGITLGGREDSISVDVQVQQ